MWPQCAAPGRQTCSAVCRCLQAGRFKYNVILFGVPRHLPQPNSLNGKRCGGLLDLVGDHHLNTNAKWSSVRWLREPTIGRLTRQVSGAEMKVQLFCPDRTC